MYETGNPVPSAALEDMADNAQTFDALVTQTEGTTTDRLGRTRRVFQQILMDMGFQPLSGSFQTGETITDRNQTLYDEVSHVFYAWGGTIPKDVPAGSTPATAGGVGVGLWTDKTDLTLRSAINSGGYLTADKVGFTPAGINAQKKSVDEFLPATSPLSYGAYFDGVNDDTAGINNAIKSKGANAYVVIRFPDGCTSKILGTIYIPSGVVIDLNGSIINGGGSNNIFESGKWLGNDVVSNFNDAPEVSLVVDSIITNGLIQNCSSAIRVNNFTAGCRISNIRGYHVNQLLHEKRSFYCDFSNLQAWAPLDGTLLPCFHWDGAIQAQGVKRCFAGGYTKGHVIQGPGDMESFDTCAAEGCVDGVYITGQAGGGPTGLTFRNWYLENNETAIKADPAYTYENIDIDNCFFNENYTTLNGPTIRSGRFGKMNKRKVSVAKPGKFAMLGNQAGIDGFVIELDEILDINNRTTATIDTSVEFEVGPNVRIERVVSLSDISGVPYARNIEQPNLPIRQVTGRQFGSVPDNTVPFCETYYGEPNLLVKTQIPYQDFAMLSYNINVVDNTGSYWVRGVVMGDQVFPLSAGQKTVAIVNGGGFSQLNISTFIGAATYRGVVKHL